MQFSDLVTNVSVALKDPAFARHTAAIIKARINEGYEIVSEMAPFYETNASINFTTNRYYDLSSLLSEDMFRVRHVRNEVTGLWMVPTSIGELDAGYWRWRVNSGSPDHFWMKGLFKLGVYPKSSQATGTMTLYGVGHPPPLLLDATEPEFPERYQDCLEFYATYACLMEDGETEKAMEYLSLFFARVRELSGYLSDKANDARHLIIGGRA